MVAVLGSTGSIGTQTLDVCSRLGIPVVSLAAGRNTILLERQARKFKPELVSAMDEADAGDLRVRLADTPTRVVSGGEGLIECAAAPSARTVVTALVGVVGLAPTLAAIEAKKNIALANKETLVCAGSIVTEKARQNGVSILPVDSEHSAIFQCLQAVNDKREVKKLWLTASGGAFYGFGREHLARVTPEMALRHPNWDMGAKVTIDSATLFNKGLECIEAGHLFNLTDDSISIDRVGIVIHRQSIVHSMVELCDGAVLAQCGEPDMRLPIQYALTYPERKPCPAKPLDFTRAMNWTFAPPEPESYPCLDIALAAAKRGDAACCAVNAADEVAVDRFLRGEIGFLDIERLLEKSLNLATYVRSPSLSDLLSIDKEIREQL